MPARRLRGPADSRHVEGPRRRGDAGQVRQGADLARDLRRLRRPEHSRDWREDLAGAELHVIYTARDLGRQLPAVWQEGLKNRSTTRFDTLLESAFVGHEPAKRPHSFWSAHDSVEVLTRWSPCSPSPSASTS